MNYFLGLDNGGTSTKASVYDETGKELSTCSMSTKAEVPSPGFVETDMDSMWEANCSVIRSAVSRSGISADQISAIAVCGHGKGLYLWGKDGRPVRKGIMSSDNRAYRYSEKWKKDGTEQKAFEFTCQHIMPCQPIPLLSWIRDNEPDCIDKIQWIFECKDYIRYRLTGEPFAEITDFSGTGFVNLHTKQYDRRILELFDMCWAEHMLPPLKSSTDICGYVTREAAEETGLAEGTPVAGGMFDIDACALAVGVTDSRNVCMIAGTWSINEYLRDTPVLDRSILMNSLSAIPGMYLVEESSATSAGNFSWFIKTIFPELRQQLSREGKNIYTVIDEMLLKVGPYTFIPTFTPFIMASNVHPNAKASFIGISNYHDRSHLIRSVVEGIVFSHRYHLEKLKTSRDKTFDSIRLAGGLARSDVIASIFSDVCQIPVEIMEAKETGTLGCAIAASVSSGRYPDLREAAARMTRMRKRIEPDQTRKAVYDSKYAFYREVIEATDPLWDDMQDLIDKLEEEKQRNRA
ncbi:MAG: FGGY-family carbohydrate kinase [Oscillospiraceae bacterium]|jgi:L-xylulokinase